MSHDPMREPMTWRELAATVALALIVLATLLSPRWGVFFGTSSLGNGAGRRVVPERRVNHPDARRPAPVSPTRKTSKGN